MVMQVKKITANKYKFLCLLTTVFSFNVSASELSVDEHNFSFHGYARIGLATSSEVDQAVNYYAPGAWAKYRLGNEADTLIRLRLSYRWGDVSDTKPYINAEIATQGYQLTGSSEKLEFNKIPKAHLEFVNFVDEGVSVWLGRRWYERKGAYINDYWWLNSGQWAEAGMGIEGLSLGDGEVKIALFKHEDDDVSAYQGENNTLGNVNSTTLDIRYQGLKPTSDSTLNFWALFAKRDENIALGFENRTGFGVGSWLDTPSIFGGKNTLALTYRKGAAMQQSTYNSKPINENMGFDLDHSNVFEVNNTWTWDNHEQYAVQWVAIARLQETGVAGVDTDKIDWFSTGARPIFYLSDTFNIATELGVDYVDNGVLGVKGSLSKATVALQYSPEKKFMSRPVIRFYVTYADWSKELEGLVGYTDNDELYGVQSNGWTIGGQVEHIW